MPLTSTSSITSQVYCNGLRAMCHSVIETQTGAALAARLKSLTAGLEYVMQCMGGGIVNVEGETARGRWTITEYARTRNGDPPFTMGAYRDDYCKEGGAWRFQRRRFSAFYMGPPDMSGTLMPVPEDLAEGLEGLA